MSYLTFTITPFHCSDRLGMPHPSASLRTSLSILFAVDLGRMTMNTNKASQARIKGAGEIGA